MILLTSSELFELRQKLKDLATEVSGLSLSLSAWISLWSLKELRPMISLQLDTQAQPITKNKTSSRI